MTHAPDELLAVTLARIETKLDNAISLGSDHERRIRVLEARQWPLPSVAVLLSVGSAILSLVVR